ncbi:signal peptidase I [Pseudomonas cichorii]|nr:signal peptidase I [Pseudomonas cichorii]MBX8556983.1 signal peptidase I [Pseudomonas cichorii]MBX8592742.1 signal peptidase I [Pseudomonas cichorii]
MSLFLSGLALTSIAPLLCRKALSTGGPQWIYTLGCSAGILGPYFLLCTFIDMHTILFVCVAIGTPLWAVERVRSTRSLAPLSDGVIAFAIQLVPVAILLLLIRSFVVEPYVVPSSSMRPNLAVGNFVLVDKISYGLRLPLSNTLFWKVSSPNRTDVLVFRFPLDRRKPFIKRVIGLPGDVIEYRSGILYVNNNLIKDEEAERYEYIDENTGKLRVSSIMTEEVSGSHFNILPDAQTMALGRESDFPEISGCERNSDGLKCRVPNDAFFVLGDNRGDSIDSRYWGFVHQADIIGRALYSVSIDHLGIKIKRISK